MEMIRSAALIAAALCAVGCDTFEVTTFPEGLEPLGETSDLELPDEDDGLTLVSSEEDAYEQVRARGRVPLTLDETFTVFDEPEVVVDRRAAARYTIERDTEPEYPRTWRIDQTVESIIDVEMSISWRVSEIVEEKMEEGGPSRRIFTAKWQKTAGTSFITLLEGSATFIEDEEGNVEVQIIERIDSAMSGLDDIVLYVGDFHRSVVAQGKGEPLPTY